MNSFNDTILGTMLFYKDTTSWEVLTKGIKFEIAGDDVQPDPRLLSHAHDIERSIHRFLESISGFLKEEAEVKTGAAEEIKKIKIESIVLCWPDRPNDGLIYFKGSDNDHLWRCDYINRKPMNLTFDE
ncbi:MAG: hypothetical protein Q8Q33_08160 [Chlamydiota bacterium]|nr:hypothetical protein [Chlamydiota bacterium]